MSKLKRRCPCSYRDSTSTCTLDSYLGACYHRGAKTNCEMFLESLGISTLDRWLKT